MSELIVKWEKGLVFAGQASNREVMFDNRYKDHTELEGTAPSDVFLLTIASCSSMGTVMSLNNQDVTFSGFKTTISADTESSQQNPYHFTRFRIEYYFESLNDTDNIIEAINISHAKYCPMVFMAEKIAPIQFEVFVDGKLFHQSPNFQPEQTVICDSEICDNYYDFPSK